MKKRSEVSKQKPSSSKRRSRKDQLVDKLLSIDDLKAVAGGWESGCDGGYCT